MYVLNPFFLGLYEKIPTLYLHIVSGIILGIYVIDNIISLIVVLNIRKTTKAVNNENKEDNTEEITKKVKEIILGKSSALNRRLVDAYPAIRFIKIKIKQKTKKIKKEVENTTREIKENIEDTKNNIKDSIEETKENFKRLGKKDENE